MIGGMIGSGKWKKQQLLEGDWHFPIQKHQLLGFQYTKRKKVKSYVDFKNRSIDLIFLSTFFINHI